MPYIPAVVPPAEVVISDDVLAQAIHAARSFEEGRPETLTEAEQTLFLISARAIMEECLQWRRRAGLIRDLAQPDNVILLRGEVR